MSSAGNNEAPHIRYPAGRWLIALAVWVTLVIIDSTRQPGATYSSKALLTGAIEWSMWALVTVFIIWLDARVPIKRDDLPKRLSLLALICLCVTFCTTHIHMWVAETILHPPSRPRFGGYFPSHIMIFWAITGVYISYEYYKRYMERQIQTTALEKRLAESRLETLRAQLQPHFLFNTLNAISAQVERNPRAAREMIEELGDLLRLSLAHSDAQEISLGQEMAFLDRYVALQKIRFKERLQVIEDIEPETLEAAIPAFILQPLVENAIRHGIEARAVGGTIRISSVCNDGNVILRVEDDGPGPSSGDATRSGYGIGISNTRERLRHLYGDTKQSLRISSRNGSGTNVEVQLPFHRLAPSSPS